MSKYKLIVAYDGTHYEGWQKQPRKKSIEDYVIRACNKIFGNDVEVIGASRTDSGVHALGQVVTIETLKPIRTNKIPLALNAHLPRDIIVQSAELVSNDFHARYHALAKTYVYRVYNQTTPLPQMNGTTWHRMKKIDLDAMKQAAAYLIGKHDFMAYSSNGGAARTTIRTIYQLDIIEHGPLIEIFITGNGFLYNMVRIIVGTLIDVGFNKIKPEEIHHILESKDRLRSGDKAPAHGLTLHSIHYESLTQYPTSYIYD